MTAAAPPPAPRDDAAPPALGTAQGPTAAPPTPEPHTLGPHTPGPPPPGPPAAPRPDALRTPPPPPAPPPAPNAAPPARRPLAPQPRAEGAACVAAKAPARPGEGPSRLDRLEERGSARFRLPWARGAALEAVALNSAGGITGGDRLSYVAEAGPGARLTVATQTAERAYRAQPGETGRLDLRLVAGPGARLEWLAQETILFDGCDLARTITMDIAEDAALLLVDPVVLGRAAMGETVREGRLRDSLTLRRGGRLVWAERTRLAGPVTEIAAAPAALAGARAWATLIYAAPDAELRLAGLRAALEGAEAGASAFDGLISARIVSPDGYALRRRLVGAMAALRDDPPPRVWEM